jgi:hypothetical protein
MTGLASRNMHYRWEWQIPQPKPGEVEYLASRARRTVTGVAAVRPGTADNTRHGHSSQHSRPDRS